MDIRDLRGPKLGGNRLECGGGVSIFSKMAQDPNELFDVVDSSDRVIGQSSRGEVHRLGLRHRAIHIWLFNRDGQLFIQKRSMQKDTAAGKWDSSASGHVNSGERYLESAERECVEELGCALHGMLWPIIKVDPCAETGNEFVWVYRGTHEGPFTLHPEEIECGEWISPTRLEQQFASSPDAYARSFRYLWEQVQAAGVYLI